MYKFLFTLLVLPSICFSETSLWHISKNGNEMYLGGTIHMLNKEDYPLPIEFDKAFKISGKIVFETDIEKAKSPEFSQQVSQLMMLPHDKTLKDVLNKDTYTKLKKYLSKRNIPIDTFIRTKPSMIVLVISLIELKALGMTEQGVDEYFYNKAKSSAKTIGYFESVEEQIKFLSLMGVGYENQMVLSTLNDVKQMKDMLSIIKLAWLKGDESKLAEVTLYEMIRDYPDVYQTLLVNRNNNWIPQIERMMRDKTIEMVLVGALHLVGKDGLLQQLRGKGYKVIKFK